MYLRGIWSVFECPLEGRYRTIEIALLLQYCAESIMGFRIIALCLYRRSQRNQCIIKFGLLQEYDAENVVCLR